MNIYKIIKHPNLPMGMKLRTGKTIIGLKSRSGKRLRIGNTARPGERTRMRTGKTTIGKKLRPGERTTTKIGKDLEPNMNPMATMDGITTTTSSG